MWIFFSPWDARRNAFKLMSFLGISEYKNVRQADPLPVGVIKHSWGWTWQALATEVSRSCWENSRTQRNIFQQTSFDAHNEPGVFAWSVTARMFIGLACASHPARQHHLTISIGIKWPCLGLIVPTIGINLYWPHLWGIANICQPCDRSIGEKNHPSWDFQESKGDSDIEFFKDPEDLRLAASFICINLRASRMRLSSKLLKQHRTSISAWSSEPLAIELFLILQGTTLARYIFIIDVSQHHSTSRSQNQLRTILVKAHGSLNRSFQGRTPFRPGRIMSHSCYVRDVGAWCNSVFFSPNAKKGCGNSIITPLFHCYIYSIEDVAKHLIQRITERYSITRNPPGLPACLIGRCSSCSVLGLYLLRLNATPPSPPP